MMECKFESCIVADIPPLSERGKRDCRICSWVFDGICIRHKICVDVENGDLRSGGFCRFHLTTDELNMILDPYLM